MAVVALLVAIAVSSHQRAAAAGPADAGIRVYRDPATGAFVPPPAESMVPAPRAVATPPPSLVETPGTSTAGGVTIDLRGAFQSEIGATVGADGRVTAECRVATPEPR